MYILTQRVYINLDPAFQELKEKKKTCSMPYLPTGDNLRTSSVKVS